MNHLNKKHKADSDKSGNIYKVKKPSFVLMVKNKFCFHGKKKQLHPCLIKCINIHHTTLTSLHLSTTNKKLFSWFAFISIAASPYYQPLVLYRTLLPIPFSTSFVLSTPCTMCHCPSILAPILDIILLPF